MSDIPRRALRQPRSLTPEQYAIDRVTRAGETIRVEAWVVWEDGVEELTRAVVLAWTVRAVQVRWGVPPHLHEAWVWAGAVVRHPG